MGALASLGSTSIVVDPGGEATCEVTVRNNGNVVDDFTVEVLGDASSWSTVEPPSVSLFPGATGQVLVRFHPPRTWEVGAGSIPFAIRVTSKEDPAGSVAEEGELHVGDYAEVTAELLPRTSKGRRATRHELAIDNRGNQPLNAEIWASNPDDTLVFAFDPPSVGIAAGEAAFTRVTVTPVTRFWRGPARTHPFTVSIGTDAETTVSVDGTMLQEAVLPKWLPRALLALLALLLLLWILWLTVLRPSVESAARDAVAEEVEALEAEVAEAKAAAAAAEEAAAAAGAGGGGGDPVDGATDVTVPTATQDDLTDLGEPFDRRLQTSAPLGGTGVDRFEVADGQRFLLADIVLQNPQGDSGLLQILRGDNTLIEVSLENFRDLDYHFVAPIVFDAGSSLGLRIRCTEASTGTCQAAAYVAGFLSAP